MSDVCCEAFAREVCDLKAPIAGGYLYAGIVPRPTGQIEQSEDGAWNVNGCCGGGCFVITRMKFCPFCGTALSEKSEAK